MFTNPWLSAILCDFSFSLNNGARLNEDDDKHRVRNKTVVLFNFEILLNIFEIEFLRRVHFYYLFFIFYQDQLFSIQNQFQNKISKYILNHL